MKAIIGGAVGAAALGGALLLANTRSTSTAVQASSPAQTVASTSVPNGAMYVDCGEGRVALVKPVAPGQTYSHVECALAPMTVPAQAWGQNANYLVPPGAYQVPQAQVQPVVYRDRVVYQQPTARSTRSTARRSVSYQPVRTYEKQGRSWKKSALIIGGSAAGGAGVGALLGGKSGAKKGAVVGGVGGLVYDLATRNK